ncbi:MAG TPA: DUF4259 domain-containing protein [Candidatus Limnocylindrales bacterium]
MGTWDTGPFDNDMAADWCGDLDHVEPGERVGVIRQALHAAAEQDGYLDSDEACPAIAAAAIVASRLPGGDPIDVTYGPEFLLEDPAIELPPDLAPLAVRALDRVMAGESEWRSLWEGAFDGDRDAAFESVRRLRTVLSGSVG